MIFSNILLGILHAQLLFPVLGSEKATLELVENLIEFGAGLEVVFKYEGNGIEPSLGDYVGIYKEGQVDEDDDYVEEAYLYTCNSDDFEENCKHLDAPKEGALKFTVSDPLSSNWPLNPGAYQACMYREAGDGTYTSISNCEEFSVKGISKKKLKKVPVLNKESKTKFKFGAPITLKIKSLPVTIPGQWISLHPAKGFDSKGGLDRATIDQYIYVGCNNQFGDQESGLCAKLVSQGDVVISQLSQEYWAIPAGKYKVCLVFSQKVNDENKYPIFKCDKKGKTIRN